MDDPQDDAARAMIAGWAADFDALRCAFVAGYVQDQRSPDAAGHREIEERANRAFVAWMRARREDDGEGG